MSKSYCNKCGDMQNDIDVGFSLALQGYMHSDCGGKYKSKPPKNKRHTVKIVMSINAKDCNEAARKLVDKLGLFPKFPKVIPVEIALDGEETETVYVNIKTGEVE